MAQRIRKQNKKEVEISPGTVIDGFVRGIGRLLGLAAKLEKEGKDEYAEQGEIKGKTKSGKEYRGAYGLRVRVGLNKIENARPTEKSFGQAKIKNQNDN